MVTLYGIRKGLITPNIIFGWIKVKQWPDIGVTDIQNQASVTSISEKVMSANFQEFEKQPCQSLLLFFLTSSTSCEKKLN